MGSSRHLSRAIVMQSIFEWEFRDKKENWEDCLKRNAKEANISDESLAFSNELTLGIINNIEKIKEDLTKYAPEWPLSQISPVDRATLYLGIYELKYANKEDIPPIVAINEAIEISKEFGGLNSSKFVNGVLCSILSSLYPDGLKKSNES